MLPYITQTPPARYQFRSDAEFEIAMSEWCRDFEPRFEVIHKVNGAYVRTPFTSRDEAMKFIGLDSSKILSARVANKIVDCPVYYRPDPVDGDGKRMRSFDHLDGGSRSDYWHSGYTRY